jgi:hypothetical protein
MTHEPSRWLGILPLTRRTVRNWPPSLGLCPKNLPPPTPQSVVQEGTQCSAAARSERIVGFYERSQPLHTQSRFASAKFPHNLDKFCWSG